LKVDVADDKQSIETRINHLNEIKEYNRAFFMYNIANSHNRVRYVGYVWGFFASCASWNLLPKDTSTLRKGALWVLVFHLFGQITSFRSIDRVFDGVYPLFLKDLEKEIEEEKKDADLKILDPIKNNDAITEVIKRQTEKPEELIKPSKKKLIMQREPTMKEMFDEKI